MLPLTRQVTRRRPTFLLSEPAPELMASPRVERVSALRWGGHQPGVPSWWLLAAHGGAGVRSLIRAGVGAHDAHRGWPELYVGDTHIRAVAHVLVVARTSMHGLERARALAEEHASGGAPAGTFLEGLVLVADAPGRLPARLSHLAQLVSGAYPATWQVPWLPEWRLTSSEDGSLPAPPVLTDLGLEMAQSAALTEGATS